MQKSTHAIKRFVHIKIVFLLTTCVSLGGQLPY